MGFFASRWIEKHGAASEKAALTTIVNGLSGPGTSESEGAGTVKSKWFSRKPKDVQINPSQANQAHAHGPPNANGYNSQLRHQRSLTGALGQGSYGTWSGPPPPLSPALSTSPSTLALETNNGASVYSYNLPSGPSREQILKRAAQKGPTDTVTATLGQQLEALAAANADGLLDDNAYRLLRQDLFQRFGPLAGQIPTEPGMVKMPLPSKRNISAAPLNQADPSQVTSPTLPKGDSNFTVSKSSRSIRSTHSRASSVTTAVTSLFRRPSVSSHAHHPSTTSGGGAGSIVSGRTSGVFDKNVAPPRTLVHKASFGSFGSGAGSGSVMFDGRSISSRRTGRSTTAPGSGFVHDPLSNVGAGLTRSTTRSTRGPPSSYHRRHAHGGGGGQGSDEDGAGRNVPDDWTAAEIRAEIVNIEEEMHRVGDMFRGLEVSRLVKAGVAGPGRTMEGEDERTWTVVQGGGSRYYANSGAPMVRADGAGAAGGGAVKRRSGVFGSKLGRKGSLNFLRRPPPLPPLPTLTPVTPTTPTAHSRPPPVPSSQSSYASSSRARHVPTLMSLPPTTPLTTTSHPSSLTVSPAHAHAHAHTHAQAYPVAPNLMSMPSRSSPHLPLARWGSQTHIADAGSDSGYGSGAGAGLHHHHRQVESDVEEVRRKRADVEARYEKRLEYLRARLKAAEIHERLLR